MKKMFTNAVWKYVFGLLLMAFSLGAEAQNISVAIVPSGPILCQGTKLDAVITGLNGPYTYKWSTGETTASINIQATNFIRVTVRGFLPNGTTRRVQSAWTPFLVIPNTNATITPSGPTTICNGQSVTLAGSGGQFYSAYSWDNGATTQSITVNQTGNYTLTVTNAFNGCTTTSSATIHVEVYDSGFQPVITPDGPTTVCKPGWVALHGDPGFASYLWSTGETTQAINVLMNGLQLGPVLDTITVTLTVAVNSGCTFTSAPIVLRSIRQVGLDSVYCNNLSLHVATDSIKAEKVLSYLGVAPTYEFEFEETTNPNNPWTYVSSTRWCKLSNVTPAILPNKFYNVHVRPIINGIPYCYGDICTIGTAPFSPIHSVDQSLRLDGSSINALVYPNPSTESFKLVLSDINTDIAANVIVSDVSGRLVNQFQYDVNAGYVEFGKELNDGIYFVSVEQSGAKSISRIVKSH